jgi:hypothetical protein
MTLSGPGFSTDYGMPNVQYYDPNGVLVAQMSATSISSDGQSLTAPTPALSGVSAGVYVGLINNVNADGSYQPLGCCFQNYLGSGAHLVKMTEKSLVKRRLQNPPPELYVCDLIRRLKSATD